MTPFSPPEHDCPLCPRLVEYRTANRHGFPQWHNAPVPSFGSLLARFLFVGLAPGLKGANRTGRPFTGDYAGDLLYPSLLAFGLATGTYQASTDDGLMLADCRISNAVRCVPPANKPLPTEFRACLPFLASEIAAMPNLRAIFAIGRNAHDAILTALSLRKAAFPFAHAASHSLPGRIVLTDSYHCSRYNTNTGRLTEAMFHKALSTLLENTEHNEKGQ